MRAVVAAGLLWLMVTASQASPLLSDVRVEPDAITPDRDGVTDVARLAYTIGAPARLDVVLVGEDGTELPLRTDQPRAPGPHEALFGGVIDGRMVADGTYTVRFRARPRDGTGPEVVEERTLSITGADTEPPILHGLTVQPNTFTPNQDGIADRVSISYRLDEPAEVRVWLQAKDGTHVTDILEEQDSAIAAGEPGPHVYDFDAGVDADAPPPPDGEYTVVIEARDAIGNVTRRELPLAIRDGGQPRAAIVGDVAWSDTVIPLGGTLTFTTTVQNVGNTPIRTRGPEPGFRYDNNQTFNLQAPEEWLLWARSGERTTTRRVQPDGRAVLDVPLELSAPDRGADRLPDLRPVGVTEGLTVALPAGGERSPVEVCGTVTDGGEPVAGARVVAFESDGDNGTETTTNDDGRYCFDALEMPEPSERTFARSSGALRLGLEYDERRTDIEYPFRWQLGRSDELDACRSGDAVYLCLPPGASAEVSGAVRFVEAPFRRATNAYLALMHEDVRRMHGPYNIERLTIEY